MMKRGCSELRVDRGKRCVLTLRERLDLAPALGNPFIERKNAICKAYPEIAIEPGLQGASLRFIFIEKVDALSNLSDSDDA